MGGYRRLALGIGGLAVLLLAWLTNPWFKVEGDLRGIVTIAFWILAIALVVVLYLDRRETGPQDVSVTGPAFTQFPVTTTPGRACSGCPSECSWASPGWTQWLHKLNGTGWMDGGAALSGYWSRAISIPEQGSPPIASSGTGTSSPPSSTAGGELVRATRRVRGDPRGAGLLFGCLTGIAAFFGALMNMSFLLAGSASSNPVLFTLAIGLMLGWRVAGYYASTGTCFPRSATPWQRGTVAGGRDPNPVTT